jgi:hypothetical protein
MCPTCYCFNITDDDLGLNSRRIRTWDNCMSHTFTLEGSGHNPRSDQGSSPQKPGRAQVQLLSGSAQSVHRLLRMRPVHQAVPRRS